MSILAIIEMVISLGATIAQNSGVIGAGTTNLITALLGPLGTLISSFKSGSTKADDTAAVLGSLMGVLTVLQSNTNLSPAILAEVKGMLADVQAALAAYVQSGKGIDLSVLTPIPLVP
jgi:hypothetical protein